MYKLSFDLEPLTYMVHFQKDDANATIRASELKPMFDRYLTEVIRNSKNKLNKDDYPILESILNKAISSISYSELNQIITKWDNVQFQKTIDYEIFIKIFQYL